MDLSSQSPTQSLQEQQQELEQQQGLTGDLLNQVPSSTFGPAAASDWVDTLDPDRDPEDRLGLILDGRLQLTSVLGGGSYSIVYAAVDLTTEDSFAIKAHDKIGMTLPELTSQQWELRLHHMASQHPNVISIISIIDTRETTYVMMELCPEGDLFSSIVEQGNFVGNDPLAKSAFLQILDAVQFCHSVGVYHRDLKPENILVKYGGTTLVLK